MKLTRRSIVTGASAGLVLAFSGRAGAAAATGWHDRSVADHRKEYARLALSREGQAIIAALKDSEEGYVPLTAAEVAVELAKLP